MAAEVQVTDLLPDGYTYVSDSAAGACDSTTGLWAVGTVNPAGSASLTLTALVNASGDYTNIAAITGLDVADPDATNNQASVSISITSAAADVRSIPEMTPMGILMMSALLALLGAVALHKRDN